MMDAQDLIPVQLLCKRYNIPVSFINTLQEFQLIEIIIEENDFYIYTKQIREVERMMRLHYDLDINLEGIDAISNLLKQMEYLKQEINNLHNRLRLYENL